MDALALCYRDETLRVFPLLARPLEVGSGPGADIVVHDAEVAAHHWLVVRDGATVTVHDVRTGAAREAPRELAPGRPVPLGRCHSLHRLADAPTGSAARPSLRTEPMPSTDPDAAHLTILVGRAADARRVRIGARPLVIGSAMSAELVLADRAVSGFHCRIEPTPAGVFVRDLGSRNGTFVDGVPTLAARIGPGTRMRVGRSELFVMGSPITTGSTGLVAASAAMVRVLEQVERVAHQPWPALILGESGVGKEGIARALHERGPRARGPYVAINAGGLPRELVESELFGHEKGAFTGAASLHRGVFEQASGGTLFLDEIGELSLELQTRLLRVIETHEIRRVGSESPQPVDVRLVCATHRQLLQRARAGTFRLDLYYRLAQLVIDVPRLAARPEDVTALAERFLEESVRDVGPRRLSRSAHDVLLAHAWPGNVRELRSVIRSAAIDACSEVIDADDVVMVIERLSGMSPNDAEGNVDAVIQRHRGNLSAAARALGVPRTTLRDRVRRSDPPAAPDDDE